MKLLIHPAYGPVKVTCGCGTEFTTSSTAKGPMKVDVCSACHPFYTGRQRVLDSDGRVQQFYRRYASS